MLENTLKSDHFVSQHFNKRGGQGHIPPTPLISRIMILGGICIPGPHCGSFGQNLYKNSQRLHFCKDFTFFGTNGLNMHQRTHENRKRPMKVAKTFSKARDSNDEKLMIFLYFCSPWVSIIMRNQYFYIPRSIRPKRPHLQQERPNCTLARQLIQNHCHNILMPLLYHQKG